MLGAETASFMAGRVSLIVAVVDAERRPRALRGWGLRVLSVDEGLVRVVLDADDHEAVASCAGRVAVTGTDVPTLEGCQIKGVIRSVEPGDEEDRALLARFRAEVFADIERTDGIPIALLERITPDAVVGCVLAVDDVFDQTPGPGAGAAIRGGA